MADAKTIAIREFFLTRRARDAADEAYEHWTWNVDPGSDYRTRRQDEMCNTLADLCLATSEAHEQAGARMRSLAVTDETTTEPAIPIRAALPIQAHRDLFDLAEMDLGGLQRTGLRIAYDVTEGQGASLAAVVTVLDVAGGTLDVGAKVRYHGRYTVGGYVQWTRQID